MFTPAEIYENYSGVAKAKTSAAWYRTLILAALAGLFISLACILATSAASEMTGMQATLVKAAVFPLGLVLIVICGAELFTGNCLLVAPAIDKHITPGALLKSWGIVYAGNLLGCAIAAVLIVFSGVMSDATTAACIAAAAAKCNIEPGYVLLRGVLCNILVCLAVWGAMASKTAAGKILTVYLPVFAFVVCGFEHSIANMYYLISGLIANAVTGAGAAGLTVGNSLLCLLLSTIGNVMGGMIIAVAYLGAYRKKRSA